MEILILKWDDSEATFTDITQEDILKSVGEIIVFGSIILSPIDVSAGIDVNKALQPIINVLRDVAKPICYGSMLWGWSKVMLGQKSAGYKQLKEAIGGFLGVQFTPVIFDMLSKIGR